MDEDPTVQHPALVKFLDYMTETWENKDARFSIPFWNLSFPKYVDILRDLTISNAKNKYLLTNGNINDL